MYDSNGMAVPLKQFWMVYNPQGRHPTVQHGTEREAILEADRLALANPGQEFYILESTGRSMVSAIHMKINQGVPF